MEDERTQIIPPEGKEDKLWYDHNELKLKEWKDGEWRIVKFRYEDRKYIDPSLVVRGCLILVALLVLGLGILVGWIVF